MRTNITEIYFNGHEMTTILVHWQHDYKQILKFADLDLPFAYEVDFANTGDTQSKTMIGNADGVEIPDEYLMTGKAINAYIYLHDASDSGETVRKVSIQVHGRPERTEEIPEPHQQSVIDQAIAALDAAVEQTAQDVIDATAAKDAAEVAQTAAETAQGKAETAQGKAEDAQEAAETAQREAESAQEAAETAQRLSEDAMDASQGYSEDSEAWAVGERNGVPVPVTDPTFDNNSKHYAELAEQSAATSGYMFFYIDERGHLIYQYTPNVDVDFYLNQGHLYVRATA